MSLSLLLNTSKEFDDEPDDLLFFIFRNNFLSIWWNANQANIKVRKRMIGTAERVMVSQCVSMYEVSISAVSATKSNTIKAISNLF